MRVNGKKSSSIDGRRDGGVTARSARRSSIRRAWKAEVQGRTAAVLLLLAGLVSLVLTGEPAERTQPNAYQPNAYQWTVQRPAAPPGGAAEMRRLTMEIQDSPGMAHDRPWESAAAPVTDSPAASSAAPVGLQLVPSDGGRESWSASRVIHEVESLIQRYPWPTIFIGMGAGFLLARRVR
jgi:hypothetical protein